MQKFPKQQKQVVIIHWSFISNNLIYLVSNVQKLRQRIRFIVEMLILIIPASYFILSSQSFYFFCIWDPFVYLYSTYNPSIHLQHHYQSIYNVYQTNIKETYGNAFLRIKWFPSVAVSMEIAYLIKLIIILYHFPIGINDSFKLSWNEWIDLNIIIFISSVFRLIH